MSLAHRYGFAVMALLGACGAAVQGGPSASERGKTFQVGPDKPYKTLQTVVHLLGPGDVVEVFGQPEPYPGGVIFKRSGSPQRKITIRGIPVAGKRPVIGAGPWSMMLTGDHYVLEGLDITGGREICVLHAANDILIRDSVIHDCPKHGLLGADNGAGSLTLDHVEVFHAGFEEKKHPIYMATDETAYPGAVFRMQFCFLHDQGGGNNVKSRAERNEIYYNWIEGGFYRELELIGADNQEPNLVREDSDVVGNVIVNNKGSHAVRIGGDGTGDTGGRYRFVNNTIVVGSHERAVIQAFDRVESLELSNNVFFNIGTSSVALLDDSKARWTGGQRSVSGNNNWFQNGPTKVPENLSGSLFGLIAGFVDSNTWDFRPTAKSPFVNAGTRPSGSLAPAFHPPRRKVQPAGVTESRPDDGAIDIGAYEHVVSSQPTP